MDTVLNGRYEKHNLLKAGDSNTPEVWKGLSVESGEACTIKIWRYGNSLPSENHSLRDNNLLLRLWDNDLRIQYRLVSTPGSEESLITLLDAGHDIDNKALILVLEYGDYQSLDHYFPLQARKFSTSEWAGKEWLRLPENRAALWTGIRNVAVGLKLLHGQSLVHRNVNLGNIFVDQGEGPASLRLGGFDFSIRLEPNLAEKAPLPNNYPPGHDPEAFFNFSTDWYGFGVFITHCFTEKATLFNKDKNSPPSFMEYTTPCRLLQMESDFIQQLTAADPFARLDSGPKIIWEIDRIIDVLSSRRTGKAPENTTLVLHMDLRKESKISQSLDELGVLDRIKEDPYSKYEPSLHREALIETLGAILKDGRIYQAKGGSDFFLVGDGLSCIIEKFNPKEKPKTWKVARVKRINDNLAPPHDEQLCNITGTTLVINSELRDTYKALDKPLYSCWDSFIPSEGEKSKLRSSKSKLQKTLSFLNHIDLIMLDARIFRYSLISNSYDTDASEQTIVITEDTGHQQKSRTFEFLNPLKSLIECLEKELADSDTLEKREVIISSHNNLQVFGKTLKDNKWYVPWDGIDIENELITLRKRTDKELPLDTGGYIRTYGHNGEVRLAVRRQEAIERLDQHGYLMKTLSDPASTRIDTSSLLNSHPDGLNDTQVGTYQNIFRTRPIYTLQGPPGTGKSTLIRALITKFLADDPMAQLLVTSKSNYAVDDMREKLTEDFRRKKANVLDRPLQVRLSSNWQRNKILNSEGGDEDLREIISAIPKSWGPSSEKIANTPDLEAIRARWKVLSEELLLRVERNDQVSDQTWEDGEDQEDDILLQFDDLKRKACSVMYATTSGGDLEELAKGEQTFDWVIVEEAGTTLAFDLALPMQTGHRWLLLGDQDQLKPFKYKEFEAAIDHTEELTGFLLTLSQQGEGNRIISTDLIDELQDEVHSLPMFSAFAKEKLLLFQNLYNDLLNVGGQPKVSSETGNGSQAGFLNRQYRMHPDIAELVRLFYSKEISDDDKTKGHIHPLTRPEGIQGKAVVWLDTPPSAVEEQEVNRGRRNQYEFQAIKEFLKNLEPRDQAADTPPLEIVILSPYNLQKDLINEKMEELALPVGYTFPENKKEGRRLAAFSIDSFQGKQADIVIISMVRNNTAADQDFEFIADEGRLNVMLSRAKQLLVMVGHFEFLKVGMQGYQTSHPEMGKFKKLLNKFEEYFITDRCMRIKTDTMEAR